MTAVVDADACVGCGLCTEICPEIFEIRADDVAQARPQVIDQDLFRACRKAAESCPLGAITLAPPLAVGQP